MSDRSHHRPEVFQIDVQPEGYVFLTRIVVRVVIGAHGPEDLVVGIDLPEDGLFIAEDLILVHFDGGIYGVVVRQPHGDVITVVEEVVKDDRIGFRGVFFGKDQPLVVGIQGAGVGVEEQRRDHAPTVEDIQVVVAALVEDDFRVVVVGIESGPADLVGDQQVEFESQGVGILNMVIDACDLDIGGTFSGGDGDCVGFQTVVIAFDGVAALVDDLDGEGAVVVAGNGRCNRNREIGLVREYHVGRHGVGEHDVFGIGVGFFIRVTSCSEESGQGGRTQYCGNSSHIWYKSLESLNALVVALVGFDF